MRDKGDDPLPYLRSVIDSACLFIHSCPSKWLPVALLLLTFASLHDTKWAHQNVHLKAQALTPALYPPHEWPWL